MSLYDGSLIPVTPALVALHASEIDEFSHAGAWLTGEERLATAEATREARSRAGLQSEAPRAGVTPAELLPVASLGFIARLAVAPRTLTQADYAAAHAAGMSDGEYVETVSIVSRVVNIDVFARGVGCVPPRLAMAAGGEPAWDSPRATHEGAWVPTIPAGSGADALRAYGGPNPQPFIYRALSLVPAEARRCILGGDAQYLPLDKFMDFTYSHHAGLTRVQVEIIAARVSALNDCFY